MTNPIAKLHVQDTTAGHAGLLINGPSGDNWFPYTDGRNYIRGTTIIADNGGAVGIRTASPDPAFAVTINGDLKVNGKVWATSTICYSCGESDCCYEGGTYLSSDAKLKKNVLPIDDSLDKLTQIEGVSYEWKKEEYKEKNFPDGRHYGVIAQELEKVLPDAVKEGPDGTKTVAYSEIIPILVEAVKAQQKTIERPEKKQAEIEAIKAQLAKLMK